MGRMLIGVLVCMSACAATACADGPKIVNEKLVFGSAEIPTGMERLEGRYCMRLSPDGTHLLYLRRGAPVAATQPVRGGARRRRPRYDLILRALATGKEKVVNPIPHGDSDTLPLFLLVGPFSPDGKSILFPNGADRNDDGVIWFGDRMFPSLHDVATGKATDFDLSGQIVFPVFDRTGKHLIVKTLREVPGGYRHGLFILPVDKPKARPIECEARGIPWAACPAADLVAVRCLGEGSTQPGRSNLLLVDTRTGKVAAKLPGEVMSVGFPARWTARGAYLYYVCDKVDPHRGRHTLVTRIWDRTKGAEADALDSAVPVGRGPGETMFLTRRVSGEQSAGSGILLHDVAARSTWSVGPGDATLLSAEGKHVLYAKPAADGGRAIYMAEMKLAAAEEAGGSK